MSLPAFANYTATKDETTKVVTVAEAVEEADAETYFTAADAAAVHAGAVAKVGEAYYSDLQTAINAAQDGATVTLLGNVEQSKYLSIGKDIILDLGGFALTRKSEGGNTNVLITGADVTIKNGSVNIVTNDTENGRAIYVENEGKATLDSVVVTGLAYGVFINDSSSAVIEAGAEVYATNWGIFAAGTSSLTVNGGTISTTTSGGYAISTNGNEGQNATITVNGGTITGAEIGIYQPSGTLTVSGGTITGATGVYQKSGTLSITGGTITGNGDKTDYLYYGNGGNFTGDALVIDNCGYPNGVPTANITGGTFSSTHASAVGSYAYNKDSSTDRTPLTGFITGGTFSDVSAVNYLAENANATFEISDEAGLKAFRDAVNAGNSFAGQTVKLMNDITLTGVWTPIGNGARLDYETHSDEQLTATPAFCGTFDGNGMTISGLTNHSGDDVYTPGQNSINVANGKNEYVYGLFGVIGGGATIKNLELTGVDIDTSLLNEATYVGDSVGALVGYAFGAAKITGVTTSGTVKGFNAVGGIVGRAYYGNYADNRQLMFTFTRNSSSANVTGTDTSAGKAAGLVGYISDNGRSGYSIQFYYNTVSGSVTGSKYTAELAVLGWDMFNSNGSRKRAGTDFLYGSLSGNKPGYLNASVAINGLKYDVLSWAVSNVKDDQTITLLRDAGDGKWVTVNNDKRFTLDLGGHKLTKGIDLYRGFLTIDNGTVNGGFYVYGSKTETSSYNSLTVAQNATIDSHYAIVYSNQSGAKAYGTTINMNGTLRGNLFVMGNIHEGNSVINVAGTIDATDRSDIGIALNGYATVNVKSTATVTSKAADTQSGTGIEVRAGVLNVEGGTITGNGHPTTVNPNGSGTTSTGTGIAVPQHTTKLPIEVNITGGTITGFSSFYESNPQNSSADDLAQIKLSISGGTFRNNEGGTVSIYSKDFTGFITGGTFVNEPLAKYIAPGYSAKEITGGFEVVKNTGNGYVTVNDNEDPTDDLTVAAAVANIVNSQNDTTKISIAEAAGDIKLGSVVIEAGSSLEKTTTAGSTSAQGTVTVQEVKIENSDKSASSTVYAVKSNTAEGITLATATVGTGLTGDESKTYEAADYVSSSKLEELLATEIASANVAVTENLVVDVKLDVVPETVTKQGNDIKTFDVDLWATPSINGVAKEPVKVSDSVSIGEESGAKFDVPLALGSEYEGKAVMVIHEASSGYVADSFYRRVVDGVVTVPATHFSTFRVQEVAYVDSLNIPTYVSLSENIDLVFMIPASIVSETADTLSKAYRYTISLADRGAQYDVSGVIKNLETKEQDDVTYYLASYAVPAQYIKDSDVTLKLTAVKGNSYTDLTILDANAQPQYDGYSLTVADYLAKVVANNSGDTKLANVANALLDYGEFAHQYFTLGADKTAVAGNAVSSSFGTPNTNEFASYRGAWRGTTSSGMEYYGSNLTLLSQMGVNLFFSTNNRNLEQDFRVAKKVGDAWEYFEDTFTTTMQDNGKFAYLTLPGVDPNELGTMLKIETADDSTWEARYCAFSYAHTMMQNKSANSTTAYLLHAIRLYSEAVAAYAAQ